MMDDGTQRTSVSGMQSTEHYLKSSWNKQRNTNHSKWGKNIERNDYINFHVFSFFEVIKFNVCMFIDTIYGNILDIQDSKNNSIYLRAGN